MTMNRESARKIGLFSALAMVVGIVIGIGVFFKNNSILTLQKNGESGTFSFWSLIASWIVSAIIVLCSALSFAQISTCMTSKAGLAGWAERLSNRRVGRFIKYNHCIFYLGLLVSVFPFLTIEGLIKAVGYGIGGPTTIHFGYTFLFGVILIASIFVLNVFSQRWSTRFQNLTASIKFLPIIAVIIVGLIGINGSHQVLNASQTDLENNPLIKIKSQYTGVSLPETQTFNAQGMFMAMPSIFFTFDSYVNIGNIAPFVKNEQRNVPLALVIGIIFSAIIYILLAIGSGLTGFGTAEQVLASLIPDDAANAEQTKKIVSIIINVFVTISALSVSNGMISALLKSASGLVDTGEIMGWQFYSRINMRNRGMGDLLLTVFITVPSIIVIGTVGTIMNNDSLVGSLSNFPTLYFMMVYGFVTVLAMIDARTKKLCRPVPGFWVAAPIAVIGTVISFGYMFFYQNLYTAIDKANNTSDGAGLFYGNNAADDGQSKWLNRDDAICFWFSLLVFITMPLINHAVIKKTSGYKFRLAADAMMLATMQTKHVVATKPAR